MTDLGIIPVATPERRWRPEHSSTDTFARFREVWPDLCNHGGKALTALLRILLLIPASIFVIFAGAAVWLDQWLLIAVEPQEQTKPLEPIVLFSSDTSDFEQAILQVKTQLEKVRHELGGAQ